MIKKHGTFLQNASSSQWVMSSFGDFGDFEDCGSFASSTQPAKMKQSKLATKPLSQCTSRSGVIKRPTYEEELWSDKHSPKCLVIHFKFLQRKKKTKQKKKKKHTRIANFHQDSLNLIVTKQ